MLKKLGRYVAEALHFAAQADERAAFAHDPRVRADNELAAKSWRTLAQSFEFGERLETFLTGGRQDRHRLTSVAPPAEGGAFDATYRVWQHDGVWLWEVSSARGDNLGFGRAASSVQARVAALNFGLASQSGICEEP